jgi:hypothetical protein
VMDDDWPYAMETISGMVAETSPRVRLVTTILED